MKAVCWEGIDDIRVEDVPEPKLLKPHDIIVKVTLCAICGSDLHLMDGFIPAMKPGDILGHEFMGEVVEVGREATGVSVGDRVVVPFTICCGSCWYCQHDLWSLCDNTNPNHSLTEAAYGARTGAGLFGYSHMYGGYAGGQAEFVRVPFGNVAPIKVPDSLSDEQVLFLGDILSTAYQAAENCNIHQGDIVAIWGCGPVGLLTIPCAKLLGAAQVIAIDRVAERLELARKAGAVTIDESRDVVSDRILELTGGRGADACIDAVGLEAHGSGTIDAVMDKVKTSAGLATDRAHAIRSAVHNCRKGGTVSIPGVYGGLIDKFPLGAAFAKGLTLKMGQTHVPRYLRPLLEKIAGGILDPTFIITHRLPLTEAPGAYRTFRDKQDGCIKVVLKP
jgi:threonine dehydrogenase-like Zn-dependent dehydrogenase